MTELTLAHACFKNFCLATVGLYYLVRKNNCKDYSFTLLVKEAPPLSKDTFYIMQILTFLFSGKISNFQLFPKFNLEEKGESQMKLKLFSSLNFNQNKNDNYLKRVRVRVRVKSFLPNIFQDGSQRSAFPNAISFGKFPVLTVLENPLPGPSLVPTLGTGCFPVSFQVGKHSGISERFPNENYLFGPFTLLQTFYCSI